MRTMTKYALLLCMVLIPAYGFANDLGLVRLSLIDGDVQVLVQDTADWSPATINLPMNEHDRLWVPEDSKAELQIRGGVYARADGNTGLDILTVNRDSAQFYLDQGHLYINNRGGGINTVQVDTSTASLRSYDNSILTVDVTEDGVNEISVLKGSVYAESRAGATTVNAGNTLTIRSENNAEISPISSPDEWEQWNMDRDRQLSEWSESSRYLPDELHEYASDFDQNGRWEYTSDYGYVWIPAAVAPDWAPYSFGSWIWIRGNYVWVDYSPWGWAPSHYGRWVFVGYRGWCWVPPVAGAVYWGPGYVGWVFTPTYVAWVPLAPGEIYYGYGYYGPASVNIATVNINTVLVNRNYRNAAVNNSVVVVRRDSFGTGRRVPVRIQENPFQAKERTRKNVNIVPPRVRPEKPIVIAPPEVREHTRQVLQERQRRMTVGPQRGTVPQTPPATGGERERIERRIPAPVPSPRAVTPSIPRPQQQQPPERVRRNRPEALKNERPLIRQREGTSVFKAQPPDNLPVTRSHQPRVINRKPSPAAPPSSRPQVQSGQQQQQQPRPQEQQHQNKTERRMRLGR